VPNLLFTTWLIRFFTRKQPKSEKTIGCRTYGKNLSLQADKADISPSASFMAGSDVMSRIRVRNRGRDFPARFEGD
jgi:hypothetical protein